MLARICGSNVAVVPAFHNLPEAYPLPSYVTDAAQSAGRVFFERNLAQALPAPNVTSDKLAEILSKEEMETLEAIWTCAAVGRSVAELAIVSAGEAARIVDVAISRNTFLLTSSAGIDERLWAQVNASKRHWIESDSALENLLAVYPQADQVEDLRYACDIAQRKKDFLAELKAWNEGDLEILGNLTDEIYRRTPSRADVLLRQRNQSMLREIEGALAENSGTSLFVLGAAHVVGKYGVLKALQATGRQISVEVASEA